MSTATDGTVHKLIDAGWHRQEEDFDSAGSPRPWLVKGNWKVIVGVKWTTFYEMLGYRPPTIGEMKTVPTDDTAAIDKVLRIAK